MKIVDFCAHQRIRALSLSSKKYFPIKVIVPQVSPPYDPSANLVGDGVPGTGETPIEKLLEGVFACW